MSALFKRKILIAPKRVCFCLKEARQKAGVSLEQLSEKTKISKKHLQALEECQFNKLPSAAVYQKNFVKKYVEALSLDSAPFLEQYYVEEAVVKKIKHPFCGIRNHPLSHLPSIIRYGLLALVVILLISYLIAQVKNILEPSNLTINSPIEGLVTTENSVLVEGKTQAEAQVTINGGEVMNNDAGNFQAEVNLNPGVNTITVMVKKKHGKTTTETRHVVLREVKN